MPPALSTSTNEARSLLEASASGRHGFVQARRIRNIMAGVGGCASCIKAPRHLWLPRSAALVLCIVLRLADVNLPTEEGRAAIMIFAGPSAAPRARARPAGPRKPRRGGQVGTKRGGGGRDARCNSLNARQLTGTSAALLDRESNTVSPRSPKSGEGAAAEAIRRRLTG